MGTGLGTRTSKKPVHLKVVEREALRDQVIERADKLPRRWLLKRPKLELPDMTTLQPYRLLTGKLKQCFPDLVYLSQVTLNGNWYRDDALSVVVAVFRNFRRFYARPPLQDPIHIKMVEEHFEELLWGRRRLEWFELFLVLHLSGLLVTQARFVTQSERPFGHELAGTALVDKWLTAIELIPPAAQYLKNLITTQSVIHTLLDDRELTHKGLVIHARRRHIPDPLMLELLIFSDASLTASRLKKVRFMDYRRRKRLIKAAIQELLNQMKADFLLASVAGKSKTLDFEENNDSLAALLEKTEFELSNPPVDYFEIIHRYIPPESKTYSIYLPHVVMVTQKALRIARRLQLSAESLKFIEEAAMLHDLGIVRVNSPQLGCTGDLPYICHGFQGREILEAEGLPRHALVAERHTGVGISLAEIIEEELPLPHRDMLAESIEEQIISYADLFFSKNPERLWIEESSSEVEAELAKYGLDQVERFHDWQEKFGE